MPIPILDLDNFESDIAEGCEYVLTSPRSLQACSKLKLKPVQLLKVREVQGCKADFNIFNVL